MAPLPATVIFVKEKGTQDKPKRLCFSVYEYTIMYFECQHFFYFFSEDRFYLDRQLFQDIQKHPYRIK